MSLITSLYSFIVYVVLMKWGSHARDQWFLAVNSEAVHMKSNLNSCCFP